MDLCKAGLWINHSKTFFSPQSISLLFLLCAFAHCSAGTYIFTINADWNRFSRTNLHIFVSLSIFAFQFYQIFFLTWSFSEVASFWSLSHRDLWRTDNDDDIVEVCTCSSISASDLCTHIRVDSWTLHWQLPFLLDHTVWTDLNSVFFCAPKKVQSFVNVFITLTSFLISPDNLTSQLRGLFLAHQDSKISLICGFSHETS